MDYAYEKTEKISKEARNFHSQRITFIIKNHELKYIPQDGKMSH